MATITEKIEERLRAGEDPAKIADERGCTTAHIYNIARRVGIKLPPKRRGPAPMLESETIGKLHAQIGQDLFTYRSCNNQFTYAELAEKLGMSTTNIIAAESGTYKFHLTELQRISALVGIPLPELVTERITKFAPMKA